MEYRIIRFLLAFLLLLATPLVGFANKTPFSYPFMHPLLQDSVVVNHVLADSLLLDTVPLLGDSIAVQDSVAVKAPKKQAIDAPVFYECTDSMVWSTGGNAYLYGSGKVVYDKTVPQGTTSIKLENQTGSGKVKYLITVDEMESWEQEEDFS
jgi:hypothetical protein